jgi:raffinose/stachyose/melibiose transport system permease protein
VKKRSLGFILKYVLLFFSAALVIFPLFFVFLSSFKTNEEIFSGAFSFPSRIHFENYLNPFNETFHLHTYFINSFFYAVFVCLLSVFVNSMAAYAIGRLKWKLRKAVLALFLSGLMIPLHAIIVPLYIVVSRFNLPNQLALMLLFAASTVPISVFLIVGFLGNVPRAVEESAIIDGCTIPYMFFTIVMPIIKPVIATVTIFNFMGVWNDLMLSLIFLNEEKFKTLQLGIMRFKSSFYSDYGLILAAIVLSIIPSIAVYLVMSDKLINGIASGAVKG